MFPTTIALALISALASQAIAFAVPVQHQNIKARSCASVELVFAAGTTESGLGVVGSPLSSGLQKAISNFSSYPLPYDTSADYTTTVTAGASLMQQRVASTLSSCPDTKFLLAGYSKGAMVVHHTSKVLTVTQKDSVHGVAVFGDPDKSPKGVAVIEGLSDTWPIDDASGVYSACVSGDEFCDGGGITGLAAHLSYASNGDVDKAVSFLTGLVA